MRLFLLEIAADSGISLRGLLVKQSGPYFGMRDVQAPELAIFQRKGKYCYIKNKDYHT